ncbi:MAG: magnesium transporter CorA family protein [Patescibacteria group bacterium]|jgi:magnesium transporter
MSKNIAIRPEHRNISNLQSTAGKLSWINITNAKTKEIDYLKRKFKFLDCDLKDTHSKRISQRPKFYVRNNYCFLILQFPIYNPKTRTIDAEEIDFFIGSDYIISIHRDVLPPLVELFNKCSNDRFFKDQYLNSTNSILLYEILTRLHEYCYPILDHISLDIKNLEGNIFTGRERRMVTEILFIRRNLLNFRKMMQPHKTIIQKIAKKEISFLSMTGSKEYFDDLIENTKDIWDNLNSQKETLEALEDTNTSLVSFKLNDIMRTLTIFSVIIFPLTLFAGIFSMGIRGGMPFSESPYGFWIIIGIMAMGAITMFVFFKKRKWM